VGNRTGRRRVPGVCDQSVAGSQFREATTAISGAKSDPADTIVLAEMVRQNHHQMRPVAGDRPAAEAVKVVTRAHKRLIWESQRHFLRLRSALREYFPAFLAAFGDTLGGLTGLDALELLVKAPDPDAAAKLTVGQITAALKHARRHHATDKAVKIHATLRQEHLRQPAVVTRAYAATVRAEAAILATLTDQIAELQEQVEAHFGKHPDAEIYLSQPGMGMIIGARVLAEFGDDPTRYDTAKNRKNYAATSPITKQSGKTRTTMARFIHNDRLVDALNHQALSALNSSPGARAYYDKQRARGIKHYAALRQLANRLVGILHGCLKTHTPYDETKAWSHHTQQTAA